jgi:hypothetical protein
MDKRVIRKRSEPATDDNAEVSEADELIDSEFSAKKKKAKEWKNVMQKFQESWELKFVVMQVNKKPVCLLCKKGFSENKADSLKKHFRNMHSEFDNKFPVDGHSRLSEIAHLKSQFHDKKSSLKQFLSLNEQVMLASYKAAWISAQKKKPFSDAEMVKEIVITVMETLLENYYSKVKNDILQKSAQFAAKPQDGCLQSAGIIEKCRRATA